MRIINGVVGGIIIHVIDKIMIHAISEVIN